MPALAAPAEETRLAGRAAGGLPELASFRAAFPGYEDTSSLDDLRASEYGYLDADGQIYLDYTGAGLPAQAQLSAHAARLHGRCFGNPHSENPSSAASTALIERTRRSVLDHFSASEDEYAVIFTPNASAACRLVGEAYPFGKRSRLVLTSDNHNSVNGIREFALARGAATEYVPIRCRDLRVDDDAVRAALRRARPRFAGPGRRSAAAARRGLFAFPAQSNFSGVRHPLTLVDVAHEHGYDVLLDAAAYVPTRRLDLSAVGPDFVPVSWYKMFGYPTGVGCLIARRDALARLRRPWFAGGTISAVSVQAGWHALAGGEAAFEDGTPSFLQIPDVEFGLSWIRGVGIDVIGQRVACLTGWMLNRIAAMRHGNGQPMARIHGPAGTRERGGTVAFNLLDPRGRVVDARAVARDAAAAGISVRTGCFCNPGAAEAAFRLSPSDVARGRWLEAGSTDRYMETIGVPGGAIRASVGLASTIEDVQTFLALLHDTYRDQLSPGGLGDLPALSAQLRLASGRPASSRAGITSTGNGCSARITSPSSTLISSVYRPSWSSKTVREGFFGSGSTIQ
jgi:selenocysteine lyase/cysteine desulfurase